MEGVQFTTSPDLANWLRDKEEEGSQTQKRRIRHCIPTIPQQNVRSLPPLHAFCIVAFYPSITTHEHNFKLGSGKLNG